MNAGVASWGYGFAATLGAISRPATGATALTPGLPPTAPPRATEGAAAANVPRQLGHGLTFTRASLGGEASAQAELTYLSCHGEPRQVDQPHRDSCNPYKGDPSFPGVLPVLGFQAKGLPQPSDVQEGLYQGWHGGVIAATQTVMGAEDKTIFEPYAQQCAARARVANGAENDHNEARHNRLIVDEECKENRRVVAERRPRLAKLSSDDRKAFATVESDVARDCR